ncbi:twin-arginine translocase TatA/TatE family subunit [Stappia indica]|uniref:Sec-independent protein translocase protein TatA n=1 Tax=Stappia indica TaxID=538381 RepID=A0A285S6P8_9HYPH|nr:twin-arginine translocase TatA/TatE family subunit [Stappia indica]MCC4247102.1 twin-arginine translocase TatA/TatE family subunit [Stappia indica]SOC02971.1 sec-independent protein translocase protein TatA [Stappia indica]
MNIGIWQILIIGVIVVLLFGRGKISELMGDVAKGIKSFKKGLNEDDETETASRKTIDHKADETVVTSKSEDKSQAG